MHRFRYGQGSALEPLRRAANLPDSEARIAIRKRPGRSRSVPGAAKRSCIMSEDQLVATELLNLARLLPDGVAKRRLVERATRLVEPAVSISVH